MPVPGLYGHSKGSYWQIRAAHGIRACPYFVRTRPILVRGYRPWTGCLVPTQYGHDTGVSALSVVVCFLNEGVYFSHTTTPGTFYTLSFYMSQISSESSEQGHTKRINPKFATESEFDHICVLQCLYAPFRH